MKVYVVLMNECDLDQFDSVWSTRELAEARVADLNRRFDVGVEGVIECDLDAVWSRADALRTT